MVGGMEWVRRNYRVPARRGGRVEYLGNGSTIEGTIRSARGGYVYIQLDGDRHSLPFHPTWKLRYLHPDSPQEASDA